jgi:hypothetical protein
VTVIHPPEAEKHGRTRRDHLDVLPHARPTAAVDNGSGVASVSSPPEGVEITVDINSLVPRSSSPTSISLLDLSFRTQTTRVGMACGNFPLATNPIHCPGTNGSFVRTLAPRREMSTVTPESSALKWSAFKTRPTDFVTGWRSQRRRAAGMFVCMAAPNLFLSQTTVYACILTHQTEARQLDRRTSVRHEIR